MPSSPGTTKTLFPKKAPGMTNTECVAMRRKRRNLPDRTPVPWCPGCLVAHHTRSSQASPPDTPGPCRRGVWTCDTWGAACGARSCASASPRGLRRTSASARLRSRRERVLKHFKTKFGVQNRYTKNVGQGSCQLKAYLFKTQFFLWFSWRVHQFFLRALEFKSVEIIWWVLPTFWPPELRFVGIFCDTLTRFLLYFFYFWQCASQGIKNSAQNNFFAL